MKKVFFLCGILVLSAIGAMGQGKFAGSMKRLVGITYMDSRNIPALQGWELVDDSVASTAADPEEFVVLLFKKNSARVAFFSVKDTASSAYTILDVIEVKNVREPGMLLIGYCREYFQPSPFIVAYETVPRGEHKTVSKAWRFNRDKTRFEAADRRFVDCVYKSDQ